MWLIGFLFEEESRNNQEEHYKSLSFFIFLSVCLADVVAVLRVLNLNGPRTNSSKSRPRAH